MMSRQYSIWSEIYRERIVTQDLFLLTTLETFLMLIDNEQFLGVGLFKGRRQGISLFCI